MKRLMSLLALSLISTNVACTLCSDCDDYSYGAIGGRWERTNLTHGRVGTAFTLDGSVVSEEESTQSQDSDSAVLELPVPELPVPELPVPDAGELDRPPIDSEPPADADTENGSLLDT